MANEKAEEKTAGKGAAKEVKDSKDAKESKEAGGKAKPSVTSKPAEEKVITINLRKDLAGKPFWNKTRTAVKVLRNIIEKNTRTDKIVISRKLNEHLWTKGIQHPTTRMRVKLVKDGDTVRADLMD